MTDPTPRFVIDDDDRYARLRLIAWWDQERLARAKVMVVGAGALGNEVLKNLALLGVGQLHIVDSDEIEHSNLTRAVLFRRADCGQPKANVAARSIRDLNPDVHVRPYHANVITEIGLGLFREMHVVIACLDNREARLWVNRQCWKASVPWIDGGIQEINGVVKVFVPPDSACYECAMTDNDYRLINLRYSCPLLRREDIQAGKVPTSPTISSFIAALQVQEAVKLLHGLPVAAGQAMIYNGISNHFYSTQFQRREDCLSHESYGDPEGLDLSAERHTALDLFDAVRRRGETSQDLRLQLDRDLVVSLECRDCGWSRSLMQPIQHVGMDQALCERCGHTARPRLEHVIGTGDALARHTLRELGIPPYDVLRVECGERQRVVLLEGDRQHVLA